MLCIGIVIGILISYAGNTPKAVTDIIVQMNIDYGDGNIQVLPQDIVTQHTNLESYVYLISKRYGVPFDVRIIDDTTYIESIHNIHRTQEMPWKYVVNEEMEMIDPSEYLLSDGDTILWKRGAVENG